MANNNSSFLPAKSCLKDTGKTNEKVNCQRSKTLFENFFPLTVQNTSKYTIFAFTILHLKRSKPLCRIQLRDHVR